jgi:hypothetical protein
MVSSTVGSTFPFSAHRVLDVMSARSLILNFRKIPLGLSLYWIGILKQFLLGQEVVFCFRAILNLGLSYVSDSNFGQIFKEVRV